MEDSLIIEKLSSKIDSLEFIIQDQFTELAHKTDSLGVLMDKTQIAKGFFSEIIALQTIIFVVIIGFIALVSWTGLSLYFKKKLKENNAAIDVKISSNEEKIDGALNSLKTSEYRIFKAMYFIALTNKLAFTTCLWAFRLIEKLLNYKEINIKEINSWIDSIMEKVKKIKKEHIEEKFLLEINQIIQDVSKLEGVDSESLVYIKSHINKLFYSEPEKTTK